MSQTVSQNRFVQFIENVLFEDDIPDMAQVVVEPGKTYTLPRCIRRIELVIGEARVTHLGHEVIMKRGQATLVDPRQGAVRITTTGGVPIVLNQYR